MIRLRNVGAARTAGMTELLRRTEGTEPTTACGVPEVCLACELQR
jgi:hypothetical protein